MTMAPRATRPVIPQYGIPEHADGMLAWAPVRRALVTAPRYWIATTSQDGSPHVIQQWGA